MSKPQLSIVIPLYNEEENITRLVEGLVRLFEGYSLSQEWVLVNNGSADRTGELLEAAARKEPRIKVVTVDVNQGYGWGILQGMAGASGGIVGYMDGDLQVPPEDVRNLLDHVASSDADLFKARRITRGDGPVRKVYSFVFNLLFRILFGARISDVNAKPKFIRQPYLSRMHLESRDWFIDAEILLKAARQGLRMEEVGVRFLERTGGRSHVRFTTVLEFLKNMLKYRFGSLGAGHHAPSLAPGEDRTKP